MLKEHIQYVFLISRKICHISRQWSVGGLWSQATHTVFLRWAPTFRQFHNHCLHFGWSYALFVPVISKTFFCVRRVNFLHFEILLVTFLGVVFPSMCVNLSRVLKFQLPKLILALISYNTVFIRISAQPRISGHLE